MRILGLLLLVATLGGCATSEDVADIKYVPTTAAPVSNPQPVSVTSVDARSADRERISTKLNGFGMEMAAIRSTKDVPAVVSDALKTEFEERGFHVSSNGRPVTVTVNRFYNQYHTGAFSGTADGDVEIAITVTDSTGAKVYSQTYDGKSETSIMLANGSNAAASVAAALKDAVGKMFADPAFVTAITSAPTSSQPTS
jgi:uncharacterized lipoprotein YajG